MTGASKAHYVEPGWFTKHVFNRLVAAATRLGLSVWGSRVLQVRGRKTGEVREVPVNLLEVEGERFLVAPRGETQWVRNLRAAGGQGALRLGKRVERFQAEEVLDEAAKVAVLRPYLKRWKAEVGVFFDGTSATSSDEELAAIAPKHPIFRLVEAEAA